MTRWQGIGTPFAFTMVPPGDYVLAFGNGKPHPLNPDHPFPDTFYPSAPDFASATVIHLAAGQQIENTDIHLPLGRPTRKLEVVLNWNGGRVTDTSITLVTATPGSGRESYAQKIADDTYTVNLLSDATYRISATAWCKQTGVPSLKTEMIVVDGADESVARITLTFQPSGCPPK
jgi:hypothetical protein